jgi:hypothetical protein
VALENLLDGQATALTQIAIDLALAGDMAALRLCPDRILPPRKDRPVTFQLPEIKNAQDAAVIVSSVLSAVAVGELTPADTAEIGKLIDSYVRAFETAELAERLDCGRFVRIRRVPLAGNSSRPGQSSCHERRPSAASCALRRRS